MGGVRAVSAGDFDYGVVAVDSASRAVSYAGSSDAGAVPLGVDATRAAWLSDDCRNRPSVVIDATVAQAPPFPDRLTLNRRSRALVARGRRLACRLVETDGWVYSPPPPVAVTVAASRSAGRPGSARRPARPS
jgi:hypothetical protein